MKYTFKGQKTEKGSGAFTLIELLVVIAIIGMIAAMVVGLGAHASENSKRTRVKAEKEKLVTLINAYHDKKGFYPPDGSKRAQAGDPDRNWAATNSLFYELAGVTQSGNPPVCIVEDRVTNLTSQITGLTYVGGILNSIEPEVFFKPFPKTNEYTPYPGSQVGNYSGVMGLVVPVPLGNGDTPNFWRYDCSSTNRHNHQGFDLWAVFTVGKRTITIGNWEQ